MTLRDKFEARYPCPEGVRYAEKENRYVIESDDDYWFDHEGQIEAHSYQARWEAYQAAMEDAVPDTRDADTIQLIYDHFLSIKRCGTWFLVTQGDKDIQLSYELNLKDAVDKAVKELNSHE